MRSLLAIYPTAHKVEDLLKRQSREKRCLLAHRVMTFPQITEALRREADPMRGNVGPIGERLALEQAIRRAQSRGVDLASATGEGIRAHLLSFIRQLKSAAIGADDLRQACVGLSATAAKRVKDVAEIFAEYDNLLRDAGSADAHDHERLVFEWINRMEETGRHPRFLNGVERLLVA